MSYTYKGFNGYAPLAAYLGEEGWCLACELRPGSQHGQKEFIYFAERVVARAKQLTPLRLLVRLDSGHDAPCGRKRAPPRSEILTPLPGISELRSRLRQARARLTPPLPGCRRRGSRAPRSAKRARFSLLARQISPRPPTRPVSDRNHRSR